MRSPMAIETIPCPLCAGAGELTRAEILDRLGVKDFARVAQLSAEEAFRLLQNTARRIRSLAEAGQPILATHPEEPVTPRLQPLREILTRAADGVARLREEEGLILVTREKPPDPHGARSLVISQEDCRPWIRGHHHQELPVAYPWSGR